MVLSGCGTPGYAKEEGKSGLAGMVNQSRT